ncbi:spermatogenesis-associated protein 45 [Pantherophis guttatus]|uniref:Spermatogenesis-associated protein 45 n=1 Tax=Pantherophis guttatus TaxID=94885 RepID=A0A6P9CK72_PANGU|nr:spermatogenesis-associated protein 45 [Pantherophis guttatus]
MAESVKKRLLEYNKMRESKCLLEGRSEISWLRPQKKHFPQSNRASVENYKEEKQEVDSGRTSWIKITPPPKEKRHFPEKNNAIFG